jgi:AcrR family transcriptional regulator
MTGKSTRKSKLAAAPKQTKGERTRAAIKTALAELINESGYSDLKLEDLCARTGLTVGAFYFHFQSKDAALEEMWTEMNRDFYHGILSSTQEGDLEDVVQTLLKEMVRTCTANPTLFRVGYWLIPRSYSCYQSWLEARSGLVKRLVALTAARRGRAGRPSRGDYLDVHALLAGLEGFIENLFFGSDETMSTISKTPSKLVEELWSHWRSVLFRPSPVPD